MGLEKLQVVALIHDDFEDLEYWYPVFRLREAGIKVRTAGEGRGKVYHGKYGVPATADMEFREVDSSEYHGILVPGGWAPDKLRRYPEVISIVQEMNSNGAVIGQICHAGWVLISARILSGKKVTSTPGIKDDMENAGATWFNEAVVVDGNLVSSRRPPDLPEYGKALIDALSALPAAR